MQSSLDKQDINSSVDDVHSYPSTSPLQLYSKGGDYQTQTPSPHAKALQQLNASLTDLPLESTSVRAHQSILNTTNAYTPSPANTNQSLTFDVAMEMVVERTLAIILPSAFTMGLAKTSIEQARHQSMFLLLFAIYLKNYQHRSEIIFPTF